MTDSTTDLFVSLTPERVLDAAEAAGLRCNPLCYPLNSFENRVYEVELEDRTRIIAKFYRPNRWTRAQILEEHEFLADLYKAEVPVCPTRRFPDGDTLKQIDDIYYCLYDRRGGRAPDELSDELCERLGMLTARMHLVGRTRESKERVCLNSETYVRKNLDWMDAQGVVPDRLWHRYRRAAEQIGAAADERLLGVAVQRVHGDFHLGNLLLREGRFHLLDFDDMVVGPPVQDLWLLFPGRDAYTRRQHEAFIEGYEQFAAFDRNSLNLIEPLRGLRLVHYAAWLARRWHDPVFPKTWPHFGTEEYWEEQTRDLEEVSDLIRQEDGAGPTTQQTQLLDNSDYFFDWEDS